MKGKEITHWVFDDYPTIEAGVSEMPGGQMFLWLKNGAYYNIISKEELSALETIVDLAKQEMEKENGT